MWNVLTVHLLLLQGRDTHAREQFRSLAGIPSPREAGGDVATLVRNLLKVFPAEGHTFPNPFESTPLNNSKVGMREASSTHCGKVTPRNSTAI